MVRDASGLLNFRWARCAGYNPADTDIPNIAVANSIKTGLSGLSGRSGGVAAVKYISPTADAAARAAAGRLTRGVIAAKRRAG
jgi:hypothetical protein